MKYVLDASTSIRWVLPNPLTPLAIRLRDEYQRGVHELIAPSHFPGEVASALTKAERQKIIRAGDARTLIQDVLSTPPLLQPYESLVYRAVDISSHTRTAFYDCLYVALAEQATMSLTLEVEKSTDAG